MDFDSSLRAFQEHPSHAALVELCKAFDALYSRLRVCAASVLEGGLDEKLALCDEGVSLRSKCERALGSIKTAISRNDVLPTIEWSNFKDARARLEELTSQLRSKDTVAEKIALYVQIRALIAEYEKRLEEAQINIEKLRAD